MNTNYWSIYTYRRTWHGEKRKQLETKIRQSDSGKHRQEGSRECAVIPEDLSASIHVRRGIAHEVHGQGCKEKTASSLE